VVLSSGYNQQEATNRFAGKGLAGFIQKPYRTANLLEKVYEALEQAW
jgi:FixJ family two-component response regulator